MGLGGARKHKKRRTHVEEDIQEKTGGERVPKSFVLRRGKVPALVRELIKDTRRMMAPFTALKLTERKSNKLKDFVALSGALGVSHMLCFSTTETGTYLRLAKMPRGPTLHFKLESYCLAKDVAASQRRPHSPKTEFLHPPLVVLNNMQSDAREVKLTGVMVQNLFPAIDVDTVKLSQCRRVLLFHRDPESGDYDLRHYVVNVKSAGLTRGIRKILRKRQLPDLSKYHDISEYVTGGGGMSDSEPEDAEESKVEIQAGQRAIDGVRGTRTTKESEMAAVKLTEIGPRMRLSLVKVEEGFCSGEVLFHKHVKKTPEEVAALRAETHRKQQTKEVRKGEQQRNVEKKKLAKTPKNKRQREDEDMEDHPLASVGKDVVSDDDDEQYYTQAVGEAPEEGTFRRKRTDQAGREGRARETPPQKKKRKAEPPAGARSMEEAMRQRKENKMKREKRKAKKRKIGKGKK